MMKKVIAESVGIFHETIPLEQRKISINQNKKEQNKMNLEIIFPQFITVGNYKLEVIYEGKLYSFSTFSINVNYE